MIIAHIRALVNIMSENMKRIVYEITLLAPSASGS